MSVPNRWVTFLKAMAVKEMGSFFGGSAVLIS